MVIVGEFVARQLCMGLGYIYPLYASVEALRTRQQQELLQWITFWTVNALFWVVETVGDTIISWVPFYLEAKIVALAWLVLPSYQGALLLHQKWLAPAFQQHEEVIDFTIADFKRRAGEKMVQVCKETAVIALRNSSDVVAQSQSFVAAQLVQQALGKLQPVAPVDNANEELRLPSMLSGVGTASVVNDKSADSKRETRKIRSEEKSVNESKPHSDHQEKTTTTLSRTEKAKQILDHFKKLMVNGFHLKYHPSAGVVKNRMLLLESTGSRYVSFMSTRDTGSIDSKKKAARLLLHNLRRVSASTAEDSALFAKMAEEEEIDLGNAFILDNGKAVMLFEAESEKSRDLLVAGLRLLINDHKKRDTAGLKLLCTSVDHILMHQAITKLRANAGRSSRK
ncbi:Receptor expression-enhancing protein 4 [Phytophthora megakarya]|uniref:Receptor expression-enhancing protein 4 n=1 Tax=Phytophthora megakarya TaxID=4795 RepID=A0A225WMB0_9STRA|nr:Receptor expression-enhancing protein 4 [Phytophthora megakarya]